MITQRSFWEKRLLSNVLKLGYIFTLLFIGVQCNVNAQDALTILEKSIAYHDPNNTWSHFDGVMHITQKSPGKPERKSKVNIDLLQGTFRLEEQKNEKVVVRAMYAGGACDFSIGGQTTFSQEEEKTYGLTCAHTKRLRDYYTYLYGLPMKLKDAGTLIDPEAKRITFHGRDCWRVRVTYEQSVGSDIWYFYIHPESFALEAYQFYHDEAKGDGEYILLSEEVVFDGIRIPKVRTWYYNKDDQYLATDHLIEITN